MSNPCTCCKDESALCAANSSAKDGKPASCEVAVEGTKLSHGIRCAGDDLHMTDTFFDLRDKRDQSGIWRFSSSVAGVLVIRCGSYKAICRARGSANWTGGSFIANTPGVMPDFSLEEALHVRGLKCVAGVDEAGRGPLAGPVAAAAVILPQGFADPGLDDSKKLSPKKREALYHILTEDPQLRWSVALASALEIDTLNILRATHLAMQRAVAGLDVAPDHCLIDGLPVRGFPWPHAGIVKGDGRSLSIAAASILAKVTRDRLLREIDAEYPLYGFARHQGYGTKEHLEALRIHGPCRHHRRSFQPVAQLALPFDRA